MTDANRPKCQLCGEPMPEGEEMFNYHGYSGPCPKPPLKPQHRCILCENAGARYVKTKGGFHKVCDDCAKVLSDAGLLIKSDVIHAK